MRLDPGDAVALDTRGDVFVDKGEFDRAIEDYDAALRLNPKLSLALRDRGAAYYFKRDYRRAIDDEGAAIAIDPMSDRAYANRGAAYKKLGRDKESIADESEAIKLSPTVPEYFDNRGLSYAKEGDFDRAIIDHSEAIRLSPQAKFFANRGNAYQAKGDFNRAIADYGDAIKLNSRFADAYNNRGTAFRRRGDLNRAIADYQMALRINPAYGMAAENLRVCAGASQALSGRAAIASGGRPPSWIYGCCERLWKGTGGDGGIRTLDRALQPYNGLANRRLQPLGHISASVFPREIRLPQARQEAHIPRTPRVRPSQNSARAVHEAFPSTPAPPTPISAGSRPRCTLLATLLHHSVHARPGRFAAGRMGRRGRPCRLSRRPSPKWRRASPAIADGKAAERVWLVEHPALYTAGTSARDGGPARRALPGPSHRARRPIHLSWAGPAGRLCDARSQRRRPDVRAFVAALEAWLIDALAAFDIAGERREDRVGVWVARPDKPRGVDGATAEDKIAALGIRVRRWVSFHGVALNVAPDLAHFSGIVPCGVAQAHYGVTSLRDLGRNAATMSDVDRALRAAFEARFGETIG